MSGIIDYSDFASLPATSHHHKTDLKSVTTHGGRREAKQHKRCNKRETDRERETVMGRKAVLVSHIFRDSAAACLDFLVAAQDALPTPNVAI